jgi:hypothetical protein
MSGGAGRGICMTGTLMSGNFGLLDLMLNSTCWPGVTWNPSGKATMAVKDLPGCISLIWASAPDALTVGSDNVSRFVLLF